MSNISKINYIVSKVFEIADEYNVDVMTDLTTNIITGRRNLFFSFRKREKRVEAVIDEIDICMTKDTKVIVSNIIERMKYVL